MLYWAETIIHGLDLKVENNEHLQILFLDKSIKGRVSGRLVYCDAFYDADGNLL